METEEYEQYIATEIRNEVIRQRRSGKKTSRGEKMSLAAIGRTLDPPVSRIAVYHVIDARNESRRIKDAVELELGKTYWMRKSEDRRQKAA